MDIVEKAMADIVLVAKKERQEEGDFWPRESIEVKLKEDEYGWLRKWEVTVSYHAKDRGYSSGRRKFRSFDKALEYFAGLVKKYDLQLIEHTFSKTLLDRVKAYAQ